MRKFFLFIILAAAAVNALAEEPADTTFEADPYFILMGEADRAIADSAWTEAAARLRDALEVKPDHPSNSLLLNNLAKAYTYLGMDSLAVDAYDRGLEIAPHMTTLLNGRGRLLLSMGRDKDAAEDFATIIEVDSLNTDARYYHGMLSLYSGNLAEAERDFNVLAGVIPKSTDTAIALGTLYALSGRERQAIPYLERLIKDEPSPEFFASLAGCRLALGDLTEASEAIGEGLRRYPSDPELYYYRAWLNRDRFRLDEAHKDAEKAVRLGANPLKVADLFNKR